MRASTLMLLATISAASAQAEEAMSMRRHMDDDPLTLFVMADRLELQNVKQGTLLSWDAKVRIGRDFNKLLLRTEGESVDGHHQEADVEALWEKPVSRWWEMRIGARHDFGDSQSQSWFALGLAGLMPWRIHLQATGYVGEGGRTALRLESDYDLLVTNRVILQPRVEFNAYGNDNRGTAVELGLRVRYEIRREIAPYLGAVWVDRTDAGTDELRLLAGLRLWY